MELINRQVLDLWNRYRPTIAVDAIEYDRELRRLLSTNLASLGKDCISRQAAIEALDKRFDSIPIEQTTEILLLRKDLRDLPTAEPQRIKGKWALQSDDYYEYYECDQCGIAVGIDDIRNFCPNCGADMRGEQND